MRDKSENEKISQISRNLNRKPKTLKGTITKRLNQKNTQSTSTS